ARLAIGALGGELVQAFFLLVVLLLREGIDLAEGLPPSLEALDPLRQLLSIVALGRLGGRPLEPSPRLVGFGFDPRTLDVDGAQPFPGFCGSASCVDLCGPEPSQLLRERAGARAARIGTRSKRRLEAIVRDSFERLDEPRGEPCKCHGEGIT